MDSRELFVVLKQKAAEAQVDPSLSVTIALNLTGTDAAKWHGQVENGLICLEEGELPGADLTVTAATETAVGLLQKKIKPLIAFMTGKIKLSGDVTKIALLKKLIFKK